MRNIFKGSTSHSEFIVLVDSTTGLPKTGIADTSVTGSYVRTRSVRVAVTMSALASAVTAYSSGGWFEIDATNQPGVYRWDIPDAAFASGVDQVVATVKATGCKTEHKEFRLIDWNDQVAAIPNAVAAAAGGLPTFGTGAGQLNVTGGRADANVLRWNGTAVPAENTAGYPIVTVKDGTGTGEIDTTSGGVLVAAYASGQAPLQPTVSGRTLDVSTGGEAGLDWANIGSPTTAQNLSATNIDVDQVVASVSGAVGSVTGAVGSVIGAVGSVTAGVTVTTNNDKTGYGLSAAAVQAIWDALTSALTTVGSIGKRLADNIDATVSSRLAPTVAARTLDVSATGEAGLDWANIGSPTTAVNLSATNIDVDQVVASVSGAVGSVTGAVGSVTGNVGGNVTGSVGSVVGAVGSVTAGVTVTTNNDKTGYGLSAAAVQAIWDALTSALTAVGSIGKLLADNINATISSRSTVTTAQVNAEVVDALATDTYAEPGSVPAATATLAAKIGWLFTMARNKRTTTSTVDTLRNDADAGTIATSAISDDGSVFTRSKYT